MIWFLNYYKQHIEQCGAQTCTEQKQAEGQAVKNLSLDAFYIGQFPHECKFHHPFALLLRAHESFPCQPHD